MNTKWIFTMMFVISFAITQMLSLCFATTVLPIISISFGVMALVMGVFTTMDIFANAMER